MIDSIEIDGVPAVVHFDAGAGLFRGEITLPRGSADFFAPDLPSLREEGRVSLRVLREALARL
ncbi:hypothetical protein VI08_12710 [Luteibacter yeojuensis]|uniref:Uncharacterized protein n=1 Tax=Luteibacter yeojuensis TaxID=345309 RepID=A0A0F3KPI9_9GAMM|nr:hypothetical protein VI08_12710 [Luteibacter yeojuensis]